MVTSSLTIGKGSSNSLGTSNGVLKIEKVELEMSFVLNCTFIKYLHEFLHVLGADKSFVTPFLQFKFWISAISPVVRIGGISRRRDVNTPPVELNTTTFTLATSRNDASGLANLSLGAGNITSVTLPDNFHIDASEGVLISVGCIGTCVIIQSHKSSTCILNHTHATQRWIKMV